MGKKKGNVIIKKRIIKESKSDKVGQVMGEFKDGTLRDRSGSIVTDKDQALAIALSEAGLSRKSFEKAEIINKIKVLKTQINKAIQKEDAREKILLQNVVEYFGENSQVKSGDIDALAEKNNVLKDEMNEIIYMLLSKFITGIGNNSQNQENVEKAWQRKDGSWWEKDPKTGKVVPHKPKDGKEKESVNEMQNLSEEEHEKNISELSKKPLKELRNRQKLVEDQMKRAHELMQSPTDKSRGERGMRNLTIMQDQLQAAVDVKEFGSSAKEWASKIKGESNG